MKVMISNEVISTYERARSPNEMRPCCPNERAPSSNERTRNPDERPPHPNERALSPNERAA